MYSRITNYFGLHTITNNVRFIDINLKLIHKRCREPGQPSKEYCTRTFFEHFNIETLWETEDCYNKIAEFFICEAPFSKNGKQYKCIFNF